jgi:predicted ribosomally synthesized peptide with nif11-like leader
MSLESATLFLQAVRNAPELREKIESRSHEIPEERLEAILAVARDAGFYFNGNEYLASLRRALAPMPAESSHGFAELL